MSSKIYNFNNPEVRSKAIQKARISTRPKSYNSKNKRIAQAQKELLKEELIKNGFLEQIRPYMSEITEATIKNACDPSPKGTQDRKIIFQAVGIIGKDTQDRTPVSIGQILSDIFQE